ncbi:DUF3973 domain-containing protein [Paenibacillus sp. NPDC056579]|uniref:DUF3973 domain-containing protein n=1 Tax=Paenibacillus sp. NPDC056579 TaxID=3345871 RepID=UPI0036BE1AEE
MISYYCIRCRKAHKFSKINKTVFLFQTGYHFVEGKMLRAGMCKFPQSWMTSYTPYPYLG